MAALVQARRFFPPALRMLFGRRAAEIGGVALALAGLMLLLSLGSYNPHDPSLNTATSGQATNLAGPVGAVVADLLLQGFGLAGVLPGLALLTWAWRIGAHRGLGSVAVRIVSLVVALFAASAALGVLPFPGLRVPSWPTAAGLGGAMGPLLGGGMVAIGRDVLGPSGAILAWSLEALLALTLTILALGLTPGEYRAAGRGAIWAAHGSVRHSRGAAGLFGRAGMRLGRMLWPWRRRADAEDAEAAADPEDATPSVIVLPYAEKTPAAAPGAPAGTPVPASASALPIPAKPTVTLPSPKPKPPVQGVLPLTENGWQFPPLSLLKPPPPRQAAGPSQEALQANARLLETVLGDYGVQGQIREIRPGPVVTLYELEPAPGIRASRVIGLADDVARSLSVTAVRIATVPGRNVIGIEVPNAKRETVFLSELLGDPEWAKHPGKLVMALGKDISGAPVSADLSRMPHLLIAGTTGSGKSVGVNAMILSLLFRLSPDQCRLIMIDPKMLELSVYNGIPHLMAPVVTEPAKAVSALKWTVREMERRYRSMSQLSVRNIGGYNDRVAEARAKGEVVTRRVQTGYDAETGKPIVEEQPLALETLPFIVVVIDEMADLMMVAGKEIEAAVQRLAQMARAAGIHVVMATQRPSVDVITGTIKANFPTRISFQVISKFDSRTILGEQGAEQLLGQGDLLYMQGGGRIQRVHGPFVNDQEVEEIVAFLRAQGEPEYLEDVTEPPAADDDGGNPALSGIAAAGDGEKDLFDQAVAVVAREGKASTSLIQRYLRIGYNRAAKLIEQMEREGIISTANHVGRREVLVRRTKDDEE